MEIETMVTAVSSMLAPVLQFLGRRREETAGDETGPQPLPAGAEPVYAVVRERFDVEPATALLLDRLAQEPESTLWQGTFRAALADMLAQDRRFADQVAEALNRAEGPGGGSAVTDAGAVAGGPSRTATVLVTWSGPVPGAEASTGPG
ncbi:hypothetical protein ABZ802_06085 [Streptomyces sp. NPDC047737]|uniref:hypothetical protein n=1 Tax=unclassified Streptomyces TaxID=2593676 RepID=UPI0033F6392F